MIKKAVLNAVRSMFLWGVAAASIGLCVNLVHPYRIDFVGAPFPPVVTDPDVPVPEYIPVVEAHVLHATQKALFVDARRMRRFETGHVPGALPLPWMQFDQYYHDRIMELVDSPIIVVYDDGMNDTEAQELGRKLIEDGFSNVSYLDGGFKAWTNHGYSREEVP
jgi:3-mercaptopyruvate sulfurtransferase SseA